MNVAKMFEETENILAREAYNAFSESYNKSVSEMFGRLHSEMEDAKGLHHTEYDERNYKRVAFHTQKQADAFFRYMQKYNVEATAAPVKLNGQYLVEIPKQVDIDSIRDTTIRGTEISGTEDGLLKLKAMKQNEGSTAASSGELLENYYNITGEDADEAENREYQQRFYESGQSSIASELSGYIAGQMEGFGSVYFTVKRAVDTAVSFVGQTEEDFFQSEALSTSLFDKNAEKKYNPHIRTNAGIFQYQKAVVLNNDTVLINGKIVTDPEIRSDVLAQHRSRMAKAETYAGGHKLEDYSSSMRERMQNNARKIQAQIYGQEYVVKSVQREEGFLYFGGAMTEITEKMNTASVVRQMNREFSFQKSDADVLDRVKNGLSASGRAVTAEQEKFLTDVTDVIRTSSPESATGTANLSVYQREELDKVLSQAKYTVFAARRNEKKIFDTVQSGGDLKSSLASLSESEIKTLGKSMERFAKTKNISSAANSLNVAEKAVILKLSTNPVSAFSEAELTTLQSVMQKYESEHTISKAYRSSIDEIRKNLNFNADELDMMEYIGVRESMDKVVKYEKTVNPDKEFSVSDIYAYQFSEKGYTEAEIAQMGLTKEEVTQLRDFLENKESAMQYYNTLLAVEKDFGIKIDPSVPFSRERLLEVNKAFLKKAESAGFQFVKADGSFDLEALANLSASDLKAIGISEETRQMLLEVNDPKKWGFNSKKLAGKAFQGWQKMMSKLAKDNPELQQVQQDFSLMQKTVKTVNRTKDAVKQGGKAARLKIDAYKAKHAKYSGKEAGNGTATGTSAGNTQKTTQNTAKKRKVNSDRNDRYISKMEKKLEKVNASENVDRIKKEMLDKSKKAVKSGLQKASTSNSVVIRKSADFALKAGSKAVRLANTAKNIQSAVTALSTTVTSFALPVAGILLLLLLLMSFISMSFVLILSSITNMFEADTTDTVAYLLYETMKNQEDEWVSKLSDMEDLYKDRTDQRYGITYISYKGYIDSLNRLWLADDGKTLYINPFDTKNDDNDFVNFSNNSDLLTEVKGYDGKITTGISTNINIYNRRKEEENFDSGYSSIENGHTSNIRDIMAMIDTMYQFETGTAADEILHNIMGLDPAVIDWANGINNISTFFKWAKRSVSAWFEPTAVDPFTKVKNSIAQLQDDLAGNGTVSYKTIENYAVALFESSHQEETYLEVQFYEVKDLSEVNVIQNGTVTPITELTNKNIKQSEASEIGYCIEPVKNNFPVYWENNAPAPYIADNNGGIRSTTSDNYENNGFAVSVDVEHNLVGDKEDLCLWSGMGNNEDTYKKILDSDCWQKNDAKSSEESIVGTTYLSNNHTDTTEGGVPDSVARCEAVQKALAQRNEFMSNVSESWTLSDNNNTMTHIWYEIDESYDSGELWIITGYNEDGTYTYYTKSEKGIEFAGWEQHEGGYYAKEQYRVKKHTDVYTRDCQKHEFQYCGGHINVHEQGVVFSATNEQIAMTGIADPLPVAQYSRTADGSIVEYDLAEAGYDTLRGKYIDVDYETFSNANMGKDNKVEIPYNDIQGSIIAKMYGVNFWTEDNGELQWSTDSSGIKPDVDNVQHFFRDIFDVDCVLLKAKNVFPCRVEQDEDGTDRTYMGFKSWTTDNMQAVLMKLSMDWTELYGFEVPLEIGDKWVEDDEEHTTSGYTLTTSDVKKIKELIKSQYHYDETNESQKERLDAVELALSYVGRGHYSEVHTSHDFLSYTCNASCTVNNAFETDGEKNAADAVGEIDYSKMKGSCTAGDNAGFINFVYNQSHADYNNSFDYRNSSVSNGNADYAEPADLLVRNYQDTDSRPNMSTDEVYLRVDIGNNGWGENTLEMLRRYKESEAVIYIGTFSEETLKEIGGEDYNESGKYLQLSAGQKIYADVPVTVDLTKIGDVGTIYFHTEVPESQTDLNGETNYWWVMPENRIDGWSNVYSYGFGS